MSTEKVASNNDWVKMLTSKEPPPPTKEEMKELAKLDKKNKIKKTIQKIIFGLLILSGLIGYCCLEYQTRVETNKAIAELKVMRKLDRMATVALLKPRIEMRVLKKMSKELQSKNKEVAKLEILKLRKDSIEEIDKDALKVLTTIFELNDELNQKINRYRRDIYGTE